jgi:DNA-binding beta-propeller fold protein YncE
MLAAMTKILSIGRPALGVAMAVALAGCHHGAAAAPPPATVAAPAAQAATGIRSIPLPGAPPTGGVAMDYLAYDRAHGRVWVPAGNTASVDVIDVSSGAITRLDGFVTSELERRGRKRTVGPSSATVGDGVVYVGNRGDFSVCAIQAQSLARGACVKLPAMPDAIAFVAATREVWVTTPSEKAIFIVDVSAPGTSTIKTKLTFEGEPEGFTVDEQRGLFYTNLEDKDRTLAIDVKTRKTIQSWEPGCGESGPKGLALDRALDYLFVACADRVKVLDAGHGGKELSAIETGAGVDDIAYLEPRHQLYVGAARAARLTVAAVGRDGKLALVSAVTTAPGARNAVVTEQGAAYLTDSPEGKILVVPPGKSP